MINSLLQLCSDAVVHLYMGLQQHHFASNALEAAHELILLLQHIRDFLQQLFDALSRLDHSLIVLLFVILHLLQLRSQLFRCALCLFNDIILVLSLQSEIHFLFVELFDLLAKLFGVTTSFPKLSLKVLEEKFTFAGRRLNFP